ncbi:hypothetical protein GN956_G21453 [Arapaima gigas]
MNVEVTPLSRSWRHEKKSIVLVTSPSKTPFALHRSTTDPTRGGPLLHLLTLLVDRLETMSHEEVCEGPSSKQQELNEENFLKELYLFMKNRDSPIERIPHLGFKQIDLFLMYKIVQKLGGYTQVTGHQLWKQVYNELGGNPRSTSAATCTRRHYEKLILPFEWHLRGKDDKDLPLPRQQKRLRYNSFLNDEEEILRGGKRVNHHDILPDTQMRIIPMPLQYRHYYHYGHQPLPTYPSLSPAMQPPHTHPYHQIPHLLSHQQLNEWPEQQLGLLRNLAEKYTSGWVEPLNLSCKEGRVDHHNQQPSSFTPTIRSNKTSGSLNKVSSLFPAWKLHNEMESHLPEKESADVLQSPEHSPSLVEEPRAIDLTLRNSTLVTTPTIPMKPLNSPTYRCTLDNSSAKTAEKSCSQQKEDEEASSPSPLPRNLRCALPTFPKHPTGRMEIQIPLGVLQDLLKGRFKINTTLQSESELSRAGEARVEHQSSGETVALGEVPADLSIKEHSRKRQSSMEEASHRGSNLEKNMSSTSASNENHHHGHEGISAYQEPKNSKTHKLESLTDYRERIKFPESTVTDTSATSSVSYHQMYSPCKEHEAWKELAKRNMQIQELMFDRTHAQALLTPMWLYPESRVWDRGIKGHPRAPFAASHPLSMTSHFRTVQGVPLVLPERPSMSDVPPAVIANPSSPSKLTLTPEQHTKFRQLISSSP